jgi:hypothetical protein
MTKVGTKPRIIDMGCVTEVFVDDLSRIDVVDGVAYLTFTQTRREHDFEGRPLQRVVQLRMVAPASRLVSFANALVSGQCDEHDETTLQLQKGSAASCRRPAALLLTDRPELRAFSARADW